MKFLTTPCLDDIPWVRHGFSTRLGGTREDAARALGLAPENIASLKQTHGTTVVTAVEPWTQGPPPEGDGLVTDRAGLGIAVLTADCVPVLFASVKDRIIGAAHAGWRGAVGGVLEATLAGMERLGARPEDIVAAIGPCIGPQSYEVSDDFKAPFLEQDAANTRFFSRAEKPGHLMFDLPGYAADRLKKQGLRAVFDTRQDTLSNEAAFFSYRRSCLRGEADYGRQMSAIAIKAS